MAPYVIYSHVYFSLLIILVCLINLAKYFLMVQIVSWGGVVTTDSDLMSRMLEDKCIYNNREVKLRQSFVNDSLHTLQELQ